MRIEILHYLHGAGKARGVTVIIDVFRAFSTACYIFDKTIDAFFAVDSYEEALKLKEKTPNRFPFVLRAEKRQGLVKLVKNPTHF